MFLLIQNGYFSPGITKYLKDEYLIVRSFETDVSTINPKNFDLVFVLGGDLSVTRIEQHPHLGNVVSFIQKCVHINKPVIGICLGAQLIGHALGLPVVHTGKHNLGYDVDVMHIRNLFRSHFDQVLPGDLIDVIAWHEGMPYLFMYQNNVCGIQAHPDIPPESVICRRLPEREKNFAKKFGSEIDENNQQMLDILIGLVTAH